MSKTLIGTLYVYDFCTGKESTKTHTVKLDDLPMRVRYRFLPKTHTKLLKRYYKDLEKRQDSHDIYIEKDVVLISTKLLSKTPLEEVLAKYKEYTVIDHKGRELKAKGE